MSEMTLEQVRDRLVAYFDSIDARDIETHVALYDAKELADAIDAHLREREEAKAEPVGEVSDSCPNGCGGYTYQFYSSALLPIGLNLYTDPMLASVRVPAGWQLVPVEPTDEMCEAAWESDATDYVGEHKRIHRADLAYKAMLAAAPKLMPAPLESDRVPDGIQVAHRDFGKGMGMKTKAWMTCPLCLACHQELTDGKKYNRDEKRALMDRAIVNTHDLLIQSGKVKLV